MNSFDLTLRIISFDGKDKIVFIEGKYIETLLTKLESSLYIIKNSSF